MNIKPKAGKPTFNIALATHEDAKSESFGREFINFIQEKYPRLFPQFAHFYEPVNRPVPEDEPMPTLLRQWVAYGSMWVRRKNIRSSAIWFYPIRMFPDGMSKFLLTMEYAKDFDPAAFFVDAARAYKSDFAGLVVDTVAARQGETPERYAHANQYTLICIRTYEEPMTDLCWMQYMSNRFLERFFGDDAQRVVALGREELGFARVERSEHGLLWQLTESTMDVETDLAGFNRLRAEARRKIGANYFVDQQELFIQKTTTTTTLDFGGPSVVGIAGTDEERAQIIAALQAAQPEPVPEWKQVLIDSIKDPERLASAIAMTEKVMNEPLPDETSDPQGFQKELERRAALLREAIFGAPASKPSWKDRLFGRK